MASCRVEKEINFDAICSFCYNFCYCSGKLDHLLLLATKDVIKTTTLFGILRLI